MSDISAPRTHTTGQFEAIRTVIDSSVTTPEQLLAIRARLAQETENVNARLRGRLITPEQAQEILGSELFFGADSANKLYGTNLTSEIVSQVPFKFSEAEAQNALRLGTPISLHVPLTMLNLNAHVATAQNRKALSDPRRYAKEGFAKNDADKLEWRQTTPNQIPKTFGKDFFDRTDLQIEFLREEIFKGLPLPAHFERAIQEWSTERPKIAPLVQSLNLNQNHETAKLPNGQPAPNWYVAGEMLEKLQIVQLLRPTPTSILQDITNQKSVGVNMFENSYTDTSVRDSDGLFVLVCGAGGSADVRSCFPFGAGGNSFGSSLSRSLAE